MTDEEIGGRAFPSYKNGLSVPGPTAFSEAVARSDAEYEIMCNHGSLQGRQMIADLRAREQNAMMDDMPFVEAQSPAHTFIFRTDLPKSVISGLADLFKNANDELAAMDGFIETSVAKFYYSATKPDFMTDWLAFQAAEAEERANALPAFPGTWPPNVGLEFPRG